MDTIKLGFLALPLMFAIGCSAAKHPAQGKPQATVFDPMISQLRRASAVQGTADAYASAQRRAIDAEQRGDASP